MIRFRLYVDSTDQNTPYLNRNDVLELLKETTREEAIEYIENVEQLTPLKNS